MDINNLRKSIEKDAYMVPYFIDNRRHKDVECMSVALYIFSKLILLVTDDVISKRKIDIHVADCDSLFLELSLIDGNIAIRYYNYIEDMIYYYFNFSKDRELWEVCANIKNFYEAFYKQKFKLKDEN